MKYLKCDDVMAQFSSSLAVHEEHFFSLGLDGPEDTPNYLRNATDQLHRLWKSAQRLEAIEMERQNG